MQVEKAYKGTASNIEFEDPNYNSAAEVCLSGDSKYLVFIQTKEDRNKHPYGQDMNNSLTVLKAIKVDKTNVSELETGISLIEKYINLPGADKKKLLLDNLPKDNRYIHSFIIREILQTKVTEAIPYFQQKLSQTNNEEEKLSLIGNLRCLGKIDIKNTLVTWLADDSFTKKSEIINELVRFNDKSFVPEIRRYIDNRDELLAVSARIALLQLGEPDAKKLLLDMISKSKNEVVRYNAIHTLNWNYSGEFTEDEKTIISALVKDKDESIARVAGFIVAKWKTSSNQ